MQKRLIHQDAEKIQYEFYTTGDADILKSFLNKLTDKNYYLQQV
jgi:hypothetical protein